MDIDPRIGIRLLVVALVAAAWPLLADQESKPTVRHHRVEEPADDSTSPEIEQAEAAMQKQDYVAAETLAAEGAYGQPEGLSRLV